MTSLREQALEASPDFPWLELGDPAGLERFLVQRRWIEQGERLSWVEKAGEGNMNLTMLVGTNRRRFVVKQARPWVEKYDHIAAPVERMEFEQRFYERVDSISEVAERMPRVLHADREARALMLEALEDAHDFTPVYSGDHIGAEEIQELATYLAALHRQTRGAPDPAFENREMRALNHQHIFVIPLQNDNGIALDPFESGLEKAAKKLKHDLVFGELVTELGRRYLADGPCLLHGDYFPGSWLRSAAGVRVIDPEFCFYGDPEFDLGVWIAHMALARRDGAIAREILNAYEAGVSDASLDRRLIAQYAATEIMRRLIGVAQLPLPPSHGWRAKMLERARRGMTEPEIGLLFGDGVEEV